MKRVLWVVAAIVAFITSCAKNSESTDFIVAPSEDFTAILGSDTRTTLDGTSVKWCEDDLLTIFTKTSHNRKYEISELSDDRSSATFSFVSYTGADNTPITANYALYPYDAEATISGNVITTTIATEQSYVKNSTNLSYALMVAKSDNTTFTFSNAGALIRFNISKIVPDSFTLQSITLTSTANKLSGEVTIDTSADCKAVVSSTGSNSVTLANIDTAIPDAGLSFYVALPATNFDTDDLTATITFKEGVKEFVLPAFELAQGKIKTVSYSIADADDFTGNIPGDGGGDDTPVIEPKPANNEIWYTTTDGKKIFPERVVDPIKFGAILISNTYTDGLGIMTFDDDIISIADNAFEQCDSLTSVTIPDSVTTIGNSAFSQCNSLTSVTIPDSVTTIGEDAFYYCISLTSVTIPDSVTTIGRCAFAGCESLKEFKGKFAADGGRCLIMDNTIIAYAEASGTTYTIPDSVTTIGEQAFRDCDSLRSVTIPDSVTTIGRSAFSSCSSLITVYCKCTTPPTGGSNMFYGNASGRSIYVPASDDDSIISAYKTKEYWSSYKDYIFEDEPKPANHKILYTNGSTTEPTTPKTPTAFGDATIQSNTYDVEKECWVITFDKDITEIGVDAFWNCYSLTSVTIPDSVTTIGNYAFAGCKSLKEFKGKFAADGGRCLIVDGVLNTFALGCGATQYTIPDSVTTIGNSAFSNCTSLTSVTIPDSVTTIGEDAFYYCESLKSVTIPDSVTTIGNQAFQYCYSLTSVTIPNGVKTIGEYAFDYCSSLTSVTIPNSVTTIGNAAFYNCKNLTSVTIPNSVTTIGRDTFYKCTSLTSVTIPDSVTTIGSRAFYSCDSLKTVYCKPTTPPTGSFDMFSYYDGELKPIGCKIYVPASDNDSIINAYKAKEYWSDYADYIFEDTSL